MKRVLLPAAALVLLAAASVANAASSRSAPASPVERALCFIGVKSHCLDNATINNPVIVNHREICPAKRCTDNATSNSPVIINKGP